MSEIPDRRPVGGWRTGRGRDALRPRL